MSQLQPLLAAALARAPAGVGLAPLAYAAGLATSFTPCTLTMLPLTVGYIASEKGGDAAAQRCESCETAASVGGRDDDDDVARHSVGSTGSGAGESDAVTSTSLTRRCASFSLGLTTTYTTAGVAAALLGSGATYGNFGPVLPPLAGGVAVAMGLNVLGIVDMRMPSAIAGLGGVRDVGAAVPGSLRAYVVGMLFAMTGSPCSTPVLAAILAYVAALAEEGGGGAAAALRGGAALMAYSAGYVTPLMATSAAAGGAASRFSSSRSQRPEWVSTLAGSALVTGGVYTLVQRLPLPFL